MRVCTFFNGDKKGFIETYSIVKSKNLTFEAFEKKNRQSPNKRFKASIFWQYINADRLDIYLYVENKIEKTTRKKRIAVVAPWLDIKKGVVSDLVWQNDGAIAIYKKDKREYWVYHLEQDSLDFHFERAEKGDPHGQYDLGMMYYNGTGVFMDKEKALFWFEQAAAQGYKRSINFIAFLTILLCLCMGCIHCSRSF